jgi:membrane protein YqaA with SNARE-associated domain
MNTEPSPSSGSLGWKRFLTGPWPLVIAVAWGFAEGTFFFFIPDIVITFVALFYWRRSFLVLAAALTGSLLAGIVMYSFGSMFPDEARRVVGHVPWVIPSMFGLVEQRYAQQGIWTLATGPFSGIPYKVYAVLGHQFFGIGTFLLVSIPARLVRFVLAWVIAGTLGWMLRKKTRRPVRAGLILFVCYWVAIYAVYWSSL